MIMFWGHRCTSCTGSRLGTAVKRPHSY